MEPGEPAHREAFERVFATPHGSDLGSLVRGFGHRHLVVRTRDEFVDALAAGGGISVIEVRTDRNALSGLLAELRTTVERVLAITA